MHQAAFRESGKRRRETHILIDLDVGHDIECVGCRRLLAYNSARLALTACFTYALKRLVQCPPIMRHARHCLG